MDLGAVNSCEFRRSLLGQLCHRVGPGASEKLLRDEVGDYSQCCSAL